MLSSLFLLPPHYLPLIQYLPPTPPHLSKPKYPEKNNLHHRSQAYQTLPTILTAKKPPKSIPSAPTPLLLSIYAQTSLQYHITNSHHRLISQTHRKNKSAKPIPPSTFQILSNSTKSTTTWTRLYNLGTTYFVFLSSECM